MAIVCGRKRICSQAIWVCWNNIERDEVLELKERIGKSRIAFIHKGEKTIYTKGGYFQCKQQHVTT
jgi:hypothetical protein